MERRLRGEKVRVERWLGRRGEVMEERWLGGEKVRVERWLGRRGVREERG